MDIRDPESTPEPPPAVILAGLQMPFWDLVKLLIKLGLAAIPALIVIGLVVAMLNTILTFAGCTALGLMAHN